MNHAYILANARQADGFFSKYDVNHQAARTESEVASYRPSVGNIRPNLQIFAQQTFWRDVGMQEFSKQNNALRRTFDRIFGGSMRT